MICEITFKSLNGRGVRYVFVAFCLIGRLQHGQLQFRYVLPSSAEEVNDRSYRLFTLGDYLRVGDKYLLQCHLFGPSQLITAKGVSLKLHIFLDFR